MGVAAFTPYFHIRYKSDFIWVDLRFCILKNL
jgi:hypothetical protein